jgi:hypothetical protein
VTICHEPSLVPSIIFAIEHEVDSDLLESIGWLDALGLAVVLKAFVVHDL